MPPARAWMCDSGIPGSLTDSLTPEVFSRVMSSPAGQDDSARAAPLTARLNDVVSKQRKDRWGRVGLPTSAFRVPGLWAAWGLVSGGHPSGRSDWSGCDNENESL